MPRTPRKAWGTWIPVVGALLVWGLAVLVQARWHASELPISFSIVGLVLLVVAVFQGRMRGETEIGKDGLKTNLGPDLSVSGQVPAGPKWEEAADPSTLSARWPTLGDALNSVPPEWNQLRIEHDDGQVYVHVKSPQGGFDIVINNATCDSPAPVWLMAAIYAMQNAAPKLTNQPASQSRDLTPPP